MSDANVNALIAIVIVGCAFALAYILVSLLESLR